jgi:tRNA (adenine57-N1/adenine58-N1)-methyltransferase
VNLSDTEKDSVNEGDLALLYIDHRRKFLRTIRAGRRLETDLGFLEMKDLIGLRYGSSFQLSSGVKGVILRPNPFDLYSGLRRLSQVVYPKDAAYIILSLDLEEGRTVVEAGTGSGFMTIILAKVVGKEGKVITYDIRNDMQEIAKRNVSEMGLESRVVFKLKDIRQGPDEAYVDAVFLDIPDPWNALEAVYPSIRPSGSLVIFVPTVNQAEKTYLGMKRSNYVDVHLEELISREYQVKEGATRPKSTGVTHTGFIVRGRKYLKS